jgi:hypothetical protein
MRGLIARMRSLWRGIRRHCEQNRKSFGFGQDDNAPTVAGNSALWGLAAYTAVNAPTTARAVTRVRT